MFLFVILPVQELDGRRSTSNFLQKNWGLIIHIYISCQTEKQVAYTNKVLQQDNINNIVIEYQSKKLVTQTTGTLQNKEKDAVLLCFGYGIRIWACIGRKIEITSVKSTDLYK